MKTIRRFFNRLTSLTHYLVCEPDPDSHYNKHFSESFYIKVYLNDKSIKLPDGRYFEITNMSSGIRHPSDYHIPCLELSPKGYYVEDITAAPTLHHFREYFTFFMDEGRFIYCKYASDNLTIDIEVKGKLGIISGGQHCDTTTSRYKNK